MIDVTFIMEQHIGHRAYYENLRGPIEKKPDVHATWVEVTYTNQNSVWQRAPFLPAQVKGTMIGRSQVQQGLKISGDAIFFNTQVPAVLAGNIGRKTPFIVATDITPIQYDSMGEFYGHKSNRKGPINYYKHLRNAQIYRKAAYIFPWSSWAGKSLVNDYGVDPRRIEVIPPGVDINTWRPAEFPESHPFRILFVGGDFKRKGGFLLLEAFQELLKRFSPEQVELALVTRSPVPSIHGIRVYSDYQPNSPELIRLYQSSDLFVLPTYAEAFGIAAVEAIATGLPVITTSIGGLTDIVDNGRTGFLVEPGKVQPLLDHMIPFIENRALHNDMSRASRARAERLFNATTNATRVVQFIHEAVGH
jgi:glycosyltransferase involved in cell wall biosynthesis